MGVLEFLFPKRCLGCGEFGDYICSDCLHSLMIASYQKCPMCTKRSVSGKTHARCQRPYGLDGLVGGFLHKGLLRKMLAKYKFAGVSDLLGDLSEALVTFGSIEVLNHLELPVVTPIPLHVSRLRERGFNQAALLGKEVADYFGWEYKKFLVRHKKTKQQMGLQKERRRANVKGAFRVIDKKKVKNKNIVLVDDVWTTGFTMRESGLMLKRAGAKQVWGLVLAL